MIWVVVLGVFLVCLGMGVVFSVYVLMLWYAGLREEASAAAAEAAEKKGRKSGLTEEELEKLEEGKVGAGVGAECAVCLEEMAEGQVARVMPGCRHTFHRPCADAWLQAHPACPLCRARLLPPPSQPQPQTQVTSPPPS
ncbi:E3 ubiquitin-protein ligase ATL23 [Elaeis guineensis]|uniref:E3 ubiquitin-protein ligase ATL23 n=1 Tax=Elaeis guineensis var. tenera TaxID=51953 RepID=A0A6I9R5Q8_ELAGV|nr:E3 ubiquitin-protein ligase ATL23 [Elaeis guineensis]